MKLLTNREIDYQKWDEQQSKSREANIYGQSWFLDIMSPGWKAWVDSEDYHVMFPIPVEKKWGISIIRQPVYCQQLGVFSLKRYEKGLFEKMVKGLKKKYFQIILSASHQNLTDDPDIAYIKGVELNPNYELSLGKSYTELFQGFNQNRKRDLKKAASHDFQIHESEDVEMLIDMYAEDKKIKDTSIFSSMKTLFVAAKAKKCAKLIFAIHPKTGVHSGAIFWLFNNRITYVFGGTNPLGKTSGANTFLFNHVIKQYSASDKVLDFEGSRIVSIAKFYKSLGGNVCYYPVVRYRILG